MSSGLNHLTVGDIVAHDLRTANVFARHGIDFCCGGRTPLEHACRTRGLDPAAIVAELDAVSRDSDAASDLSTWPLDAVIRRIVAHHHAYVRAESVVIRDYLAKLVTRHGGRHPELVRLQQVMAEVFDELTRHMQKEEVILFPYIAALVDAEQQHRPRPLSPFGSIRNPIRMMEAEHQDAAAGLSTARTLANGYEPPDDACATWRACYASIEAFESDLHEHVHLENNILFPAAERLEQELLG
jgi:regulator of cell morphogenesis and NO signaling